MLIPEEESANFYWAIDDVAKQYSRKIIDPWVSVALVLPISLETWLSLDPFYRRSIELHVEEIVSQRESAKAEQKRQLDLQLSRANSELKFLDTTNSSIQRILNRF